MTWRSLGDSNPCFRRERAKLAGWEETTGLFDGPGFWGEEAV